MKKILCPVDFSDQSENAIRYACELAEKVNAGILLFHAFHVKPSDPKTFDPFVEYSRMLESLSERVRGNYKDLAVSSLIRKGLVNDIIPSVVKQEGVDLVLMSTEGVEGILSMFGTISASVIEKTQCPVWVIPSNWEYSPIREIVYATDLHGNESQVVLKIVELAKIFDAHIAVLNIQKEEPDNVKQVIEYALNNIVHVTDYQKISFQVNENRNIAEGISKFLNMMNADVLVMATHKMDFWEKLIKNSFTQKLVNHTKIPLIALHKESVEQENII